MTAEANLPPEEKDEKLSEAKRVFESSIEHISDDEVEAAAETGQEKIDRLSESVPKALAGVWEDTKTMVAMSRDYVSGRYRDIPFATIAAIAGAVLYFVSPYDVIPDFILGLGYVDDATVLAVCLKMVHNDLQKYRHQSDLTVDDVEIVGDANGD